MKCLCRLSVLALVISLVGCAPASVQSRPAHSGDSDVSSDRAPEQKPIETLPEIVDQLRGLTQSFIESPRSVVIAVCPLGFREALRPWIARREQEGLRVVVIDSQPTATELKQSLEANADPQCKYILLVGDAQYSPAGEPNDPRLYTPTVYRTADVSAPYQESAQLPGDWSFGDFDNDGIVSAAVGRIPAQSPEKLTEFIQRIIAYEDSQNFGRWRSRVDLVAGVGGFGPVVDGAIELVAGGIITGSLPGSVRTRITQASPTSQFFPGADQFTATVLKNYQDGSRFWVYAGHGWVNELDRVPSTPFGRPVLSLSDLPHLQQANESAPIALLLACYTGAYDLPDDCLAERMLLTDNGPIAVLAGSRVTMPYGNAATAISLIDAVYNDHSPRLGDAWLKTMKEMTTPTNADPKLQSRRMLVDGIATVLGGGARVDDERREHVQLYNWLGDPTLRIDSSKEVEIQKPSDAVVGQVLKLQGTTPIAGEMTIELHRRLGTQAWVNEAATLSYESANNTVIAARTVHVERGIWNLVFDELPVPPSNSPPAIPITIKVDVVGSHGFASGSQATWMRANGADSDSPKRIRGHRRQ